MYNKLSDLRILKLALAVEHSFEDYEAELMDQIEDDEIRDRLAPLFEDGPAHARLRQFHEQLEEGAPGKATTEDALQVMLECERSARDIYLRYLDRVNDPRLIEILRGLAAEEEEHARIVEQAILMLRQRRTH